MRSAALWLILFAAYAATLGLHAFDDSDYAGDEPHYLLAAESLVDDGDIDVKDEYAARAYDDFYPYDLDVHGDPTNGRLHEPHGVGFPVLIAPAYAIGGAEGVELFLAAIAALAVVLGYRLALRVVPDPWASGAALAVGLSPPFLAYGTRRLSRADRRRLPRRRGAARAASSRRASRGGPRSAASCCSGRCRGSAPSSCRPGS